ncbi:MAG: VOC family protein [Lachnospiraceae bacterium]|nr:VOC family protein [Lachnospiraceae bacterium]
MLLSSYIYIPVGDLEEAAGWYEKNLEFKVIYKDDLYFDMRTDNGVKIMLIPREKNITSQMQYSTGEQPAYGFCVDDFDVIKEKLEMNNVKIGEVFDYFGRSFSFFDLDGNKIEIWEDYEYNVRR